MGRRPTTSRPAGMMAGSLPFLRAQRSPACLTALSGRNNNFLEGFTGSCEVGVRGRQIGVGRQRRLQVHRGRSALPNPLS